MKPPQPHEDETSYRQRTKIESVDAATALLDEHAIQGPDFDGSKENNYHEHLAALMDAVAQRLADEGITWSDIAYVGQTAAESDLFDNGSYEMLSHILTGAVDLTYLEARRAVAGRIEQRERQVRLSRPSGSDVWRTNDEEPPY